METNQGEVVEDRSRSKDSSEKEFEKEGPRVVVAGAGNDTDGATRDIPGWREVLDLSNLRWRRFKYTASSLAYILIFFAYIVIGVMALMLDGTDYKPGSYQDRAIVEGIKWAVTIWPYVFGLLLAQTLRVFALWKAERGTRLLTLEAAIGARSFGSALCAPYYFGTVNIVILSLLFLWAWSPINGQALQRLFLDPNLLPIDFHVPLHYMDTSKGPSVFLRDELDPASPLINSIYTSSIMSAMATRSTSQDRWHNPKIPAIRELAGTTADHGDGWLYPDSLDALNTNYPSNSTYSSLLGIPVAGFPYRSTDQNIPEDSRALTTNFTIETAYIELDCRPIQLASFKEVEQLAVSAGVKLRASLSKGDQSPHMYIGVQPANSTIWFSSMSTDPRNETDPRSSAISLAVHDSTRHAYTTCQAWPVLVEVEISCPHQNSCAAKRLRASPNNSTKAASFLDPLFGKNSKASDPSQTFASAFANATGITPDSDCTLTELYLNNPDELWRSADDPIQLEEINPDVLRQRLREVFNSFYQAGFSWTYQISNMPASFPSSVSTPVVDLDATFERWRAVYHTCREWVAVLFVCCAVGLVVAGASIYFACTTRVPDVLGYASSLTRDNPYTPMPPGGSALDGLDRTKLAANMRVTLHDVRPDEECGLIAFSSVEGGAPLQVGRRYH